MVDSEGNPTWESDDFFREKFDIEKYKTYMTDSDAD